LVQRFGIDLVSSLSGDARIDLSHGGVGEEQGANEIEGDRRWG
jgi:hypothetical protein